MFGSCAATQPCPPRGRAFLLRHPAIIKGRHRMVVTPTRQTLKTKSRAIPHNSKCRYGERGAAAAKPKAQIILCAAKVSAAGGGYSEPKQGQRSQSARGFCPRSTMRVPQPDILEHFCNADGAPQPLKRCLSRQAEIVRCCLGCFAYQALARAVPRALQASVASPSGAPLAITGSATSRAPAA